MYALTINVGLAIAVVIAIAYLLFVNVKHVSKGVTEHFVEDSKYKNRLNVMKIFDAVLNRKPTLAEIEKFSETDNEQNMLDNIVNQYTGKDVVVAPSSTTPAETVKPLTDTPVMSSIPKSFKTFSMEEVNVLVKKLDDVMTSVTEFKQQLLL